MARRRFVLEMGMGNDLHGGDYTKAAIRAVEDALHHSSLSFIRALSLDVRKMEVDVTIGVREPAKVDLARVQAALPYGVVTARVTEGGLDVADPGRTDPTVIAVAAVEVFFDVP